jgi:hypothetical protein
MKMSAIAGATLAVFAAILPAFAADDASLTRMAMCRDSWVEWGKGDPAKFNVFAEHIHAAFSRHGNDPYMLPKVNVSVLGLHVAQVFPQSVGMGVGFSLTVDAAFDKARAAMEEALGKKLAHCEASDGMKTCDLEVAPQRTVTLMAEDNPRSHQTLIGCYYYYEK